jgi:nickel-type superoxide dismutase maturation protease
MSPTTSARSRYGRVDVVGDSMRPTLRPGDRLVVEWGAKVAPGAIVVVRRPDQRDLLVVKRVRERRKSGWVVVGDNPDESTDSRTFGAIPDHLVEGVVIARYWPRPKRFPVPV